MEDKELEELKKRKMNQLQQAQEAEAAKQQQVNQALAQIETILRQVLTTDAWEQWNNAKLSNSENAYLTGANIARMAQSGKIQGKINKEQLKAMLRAVSSQTRRDFNIQFK